MGNTNFSLWGMGNLKTNIPQYSPQWGILGINPRAKRAMFTFLQTRSVTRQTTFNRTKIGGKYQNQKFQMRHFE